MMTAFKRWTLCVFAVFCALSQGSIAAFNFNRETQTVGVLNPDHLKKGGFVLFAGSLESKDLIRQTPYLKNPRPKTSISESSPRAVLADTVDRDKCMAMLQDAVIAFNSSSANGLIQEITVLRELESGEGQGMVNDLLDWLLEQGPDSPDLPLWSRIGSFSRFSKRARWNSLRRTLDMTTPPLNAQDEGLDTPENQQRRRRRAFVTVLRLLSSDADAGLEAGKSKFRAPAIRQLEEKAAREKRLSNRSNVDLTTRRPKELETPNYVVLEKKSNNFEIRRYEDFSVCSVSMSTARPKDSSKTDAAISEPTMRGASAFGALAGYLFGKNEEKTAMKMTTPVLVDKDTDMMSFVLPSDFWKDESLAPQPLKESGVTLKRFEGGERAVIMYGGYASKKATEQQTQILLEELAKNDDWEAAEEVPSIVSSQYNDPFTPMWKRLNEVSVSVKPKAIESTTNLLEK